jgi:hypothetical protein
MLEILNFTIVLSLFVSYCLLRQRDRWKTQCRKTEKALRLSQDNLQDAFVIAERQLKQKFDASNAKILSQALVGESFLKLQSQMSCKTESAFNRISQEFLGSLNDKAEPIASELKTELTDQIWNTFQCYKQLAKDAPVVFPDGCKIAYTKGSRTIILIEQKPQTRTIFVDKSLLSKADLKQSDKIVTEDGYRYNLAFPFVYFVIVFDSWQYTYHEVYFRNKSLVSVREHIHLAPLPNVFRQEGQSKAMCMGIGFEEEIAAEKTIARQCELVIADFWQRTFNDDLGSGNFSKLDSKIKNFGIWQENSQKNPLFVLGIDWPKGKTVKSIIDFMLNDRSRDVKLDFLDGTIESHLDAGVNLLATQVKSLMQAAKNKSFGSPKFDQEARTILESIVTSHTSDVWEHLLKQIKE